MGHANDSVGRLRQASITGRDHPSKNAGSAGLCPASPPVSPSAFHGRPYTISCPFHDGIRRPAGTRPERLPRKRTVASSSTSRRHSHTLTSRPSAVAALKLFRRRSDRAYRAWPGARPEVPCSSNDVGNGGGKPDGGDFRRRRTSVRLEKEPGIKPVTDGGCNSFR